MKRMKQNTTYGSELEKPVAAISTGLPHLVSQQYFEFLKKQAESRGTFINFHASEVNPEKKIGIVSHDLGEQGLDNGFNLLETSLPPVNSLLDLQKKMEQDLITTNLALNQEGAAMLNLSIHPLGKRDLQTYCKTVAPKLFYTSLWLRGWDHAAGIDARAQNSPSTGVAVENAADAVSVIIGAGAAFIALFGNGPYEDGVRAKYKEARLALWSRMVRHSKIPGDKQTIDFPAIRFRTLAEYFTWMHGGETGIFFVIASQNYKHAGGTIATIVGDPSVLEYLAKPSWDAFDLSDLVSNFPPKPLRIIPRIIHMEVLQWQQFTGARIRYKLKNHDSFDLPAFLAACQHGEKKEVEEIFKKYVEYMYLEGRDSGANYPDAELLELGKEIANSTFIAPSALQAGLLRNLIRSAEYIDSFPWEKLRALRNEAIADGLAGKADGTSVYEFTKMIFSLASEKLSKEEQNMLAYPEYVLRTKQNGADRAIAFVEKQKGDLSKRIQALVKSRFVKPDL